MKKRDMFLKAIFALLPLVGFSQEVMVTDETGQCLLFDLKGERSFSDLSTEIAQLVGGEVKPRKLILEVDSPRSPFFQKQVKSSYGDLGGYLGYPRDYNAVVTSDDLNDLRFLLTTLASKSLVTIAKNKTALEAAGARLDPIHPLRFLLTIFTNEDLKVAMRTVRGRGSWLWSNFLGGLKQTLTTEASIDNIKEDMIADFSKNLGIDPALILPSLQRKDWDDFVNLLIALVPRKEDPKPIDN